MELNGFEVEARAGTDADRHSEVHQWYLEVFGVVPRLSASIADLDAAVAELSTRGVATEPLDTDDDVARAVRVLGPGGTAVDLVQPAPPGHYEAQIDDFVRGASPLEGPPTEELAATVVDIVAGAWGAIAERLEGVAHDKVLATFLLLGSQARAEAPDADGYWQRSAASTLLSGFVGRGASATDG